MKSNVDIIIPVYNELKFLQKCIDSIFEYTDMTKHKLILINDNSSDYDTKVYLEDIKNKNNVLVIDNEVNSGFSYSVNKGILASKNNDVVLLNSDTIVTNKWLENIIECAYSDEQIGIVNPFSNNATIVTLESFYEAEKLGIGVQQYGEIVECLSQGKFEHIPVAVGFCMFIKRDVINNIGLLNQDKFKRGYGEDNEFCYRAIDAGYSISLADNTFVWHYGGGTFSEKERKELIKKNKAYIYQNYSKHIQCTNEFIMQNHIEKFDKIISRKIKSINGRKNILYYLHADFKDNSSNNVGGTQFHVKDIVKISKYKFNCYVIAKDRDSLLLTEYIDDQVNEYRFFIDELSSPFIKTQKSYKIVIGSVLDYFSIDCIHVHHTFGQTLDIFFEGDKRNIPIYMTLHDFYYICPKINLMNYENDYCFEKFNIDNCKDCLNKSLNLNIKSIQLWHTLVQEIMDMCKEIFVPSYSTKEIYSTIYRKNENKMTVIRHGISIENNNYLIDHSCEKFNIAFIGGLNYIKGSKLVKDIILNCDDKNIHYHLFGIIGDRDLLCLENYNLTKHGRYERNEISKLLKLHNINLVCILSQCPETFCYTLSESIASNIPVCVTDIGALGERVENMKCGWIIKYKSSEKEVLEKIYKIKNNKEEYIKICNKIKTIKSITVDEMVNVYINYYKDIVSIKLNPNNEQIKIIHDGYSLANSERLEIDEMFVEKYKTIENELNNIKNSVLYKVCLLLWNYDIPFKDIMKSVIKKIYTLAKKTKIIR